MLTSKSRLIHLHGRSIIQMLSDLRLNYALVSSTLVFLGFFLNYLKGFDWPYMAVFLGIFFANVFGFVVNDFYDAASDDQEIRKKKRNLFCSSKTKRLAQGVLYASLSLSFFFGGIVSPSILLIIILLNTLAFFYSAPPIKLRNRPYWDWIFVFLWKGLIIFAGQFYFSGMMIPRDPFTIGTLAIILLLSLISQINNQLRDFNVDKITNTTNSVQHIGFRTASSLHRVLLVLFFTFSLGFCAFFGLYLTMVLLLLNVSLYYLVHPSKFSNIPEYAHLWIISTFLEHFTDYLSYQQQQIISVGIILIAGLTIWYGKRINLFKRPLR